MRCQNIFRRSHGLRAIGHSELPRHHLDLGEFGLHDVVETALAIHGGGAAGSVHEHCDGPLATHQARQFARPHAAGLIVIGGQKRHVVGGIHTRVEYRNWNADFRCPIERAIERLAFRGGDRETIHMLRDHRVHYLHLPIVLSLQRRPVPYHVHAVFLPSRFGASSYGEPKDVRGSLGNDGDPSLLAGLACTQQQQRNKRGSQLTPHSSPRRSRYPFR